MLHLHIFIIPRYVQRYTTTFLYSRNFFCRIIIFVICKLLRFKCFILYLYFYVHFYYTLLFFFLIILLRRFHKNLLSCSNILFDSSLKHFQGFVLSLSFYCIRKRCGQLPKLGSYTLSTTGKLKYGTMAFLVFVMGDGAAPT